MSFKLDLTPPRTKFAIPQGVLKITAFRAHNVSGQFGLDGIALGYFADVDDSKANPPSFEADYTEALADGTSTVALTDAENAEIKAAVLAKLYEVLARRSKLANAEVV